MNGQEKEKVETLECGTSLAETEHQASAPPLPRPSSAQDSQHPLSTNTEIGNGQSVSKQQGSNCLQKAETTTISTSTSVKELRDALASDVLTTSYPYERFSSPFEVPGRETKKTNKEQKNDSKARAAPNNSKDKFLSLPLIYCDQTASNRPVRSIEEYMKRVCLPMYGNTHTNTSVTGSQSTAFVAEARQIVAEAVNAKITGKAALDTVLFAGNGTTSAVELLIDCLGLKHYRTGDQLQQQQRPVVFVCPYSHHSNLLPWRESGCEIVMVPETTRNGVTSVDLEALDTYLQKSEYANRLKMGTFTAASNVTGKVCDVDAITATLHRRGALAFFDYATGAPYLPMNMNPTAAAMTTEIYMDMSPELVAKDAIFISPHKMLGGVGTPGILVVKKQLVNQINAPSRSGGGTVFYVTHTHHRFLSNRMERYEGGTPNVSGIMRCGLTFLLKRQAEVTFRRLAGVDSKHERSLLDAEYATFHYVVKQLKQRAPNLVLLGHDAYGKSNDYENHLPIFSFLIRCGKRFLHYNFVCALLNDVFGIQSRGGCQCAGPYSQKLLGLTTCVEQDGDPTLFRDVPNQRNQQVEHALVHYKERAELLRPGYTRLSLPFKGLRQEEVDYVLSALEWVARNGWNLLCQYRCNHRTGEWRHFSRQGKPLGAERKWLSHYEYRHPNEQSTFPLQPTCDTLGASVLQDALKAADALLEEARSDQQNIVQALKMQEVSGDGSTMEQDDAVIEELRWFVYPKEVAAFVSQKLDVAPGTDEPSVLGAIQPLTGLQLGSLLQPPPTDVTSAAINSRKRKLPGEIGTARQLMQYNFRDNGGSHSGVATLDEIVAGIDEWELSESCEVFHPQSDSWILASAFIALLDKKAKVGNDENEQPKPARNEGAAQSVSLVPANGRNGHLPTKFRDGHHTGEAPLEEVLAGIDEGELSEQCQLFDEKSDSWMSVPQYQQKIGRSREATISSSSNGGIIPASNVAFSELKDLKNQKKKPIRTSEAWGQASFVPVHAPTPRLDLTESTSQVHAERQQQVTDPKKKKGKHKGIKPPAKMMRMCTQAMIQWKMLEDGDRLLLGLSGGKDSLSLLHVLLEFKRKLPIKFELEVCTIDPLTPSFDPSPLIPYVESLGLKYHYIRDNIVERANSSGRNGNVVSSLCAYCARMKRGNLYTCARENKCNKLVLAQHLDDCAESFLMSVMHNGFLRTMKANYKVNAGDISVIRPMVYCRESLMTEFAKNANLPVINENCPACFEEPKERARVKKLLSREESLYPNFYDNIRHALIPLMHEDSTAILRCYMEEAVARSRKENHKKVYPGFGGPKAHKHHIVAVDREDKERPPIIENERQEQIASFDTKRSKLLLSEASEDELLLEIAKRKADRFRLSGADAHGRGSSNNHQRNGEDNALPPDPTGQVCSLNGGNGTIPCTELME